MIKYGEGFSDKFNIALTCASGVEKTLKSELVRLGYPEAPAENGVLQFSGDAAAVARLNLNLRTADRVYIVLAEFSAVSFDELFDGAYSVRWEDYIPSNAKIIVNGKCVKSTLFSISDCQSIINKAVCSRLCEKFRLGRLPEDGADYSLEFFLFKDTVKIMLNTSGAGLHKRGYRDLVGIAPIKETLAAAMILMSDYYKERPFADPFCGSGTLAIEAARIALNIAGGMGRRFAFNDWENFDGAYFDAAYEEALSKEERNRKVDILGSDIDGKAIKLCERHAERAGVKNAIRFSVCDVRKFSCDLSGGTIVTNPPYGERVYDRREADECYRSLSYAYKTLDRWSLFLITSSKTFEREFGKKCDRERKLYNSNKECRYYFYYGDKK